jgi:hypothetical protein
MFLSWKQSKLQSFPAVVAELVGFFYNLIIVLPLRA